MVQIVSNTRSGVSSCMHPLRLMYECIKQDVAAIIF